MQVMGQDQQPLWRQAAAHSLHASFLLKAHIEEALQSELGLLLADNEAMLHLDHAETPPRMSDIAHRLILSPGGTTKVIDRLESMGYVIRKPDPTDRRATIVELTDDGREAMAQARKVIDQGLAAHWAIHVNDEESAVILEVMKRVLGDHHA
jgi:DNA-binding MarR family transcriptional regulator